MPDNFTQGEVDSDSAAPPIETMGARYGISVTQEGRGAHEQQVEPYLMPNVVGRNGGNETFLPDHVIAPDATAPGFAINPAIPVGSVGAQMTASGQSEAFGAGISDGTF